MSTHVHLVHHGHVETAWRRWLVEFIVLALAVTGFYFGITNFIKGDVDLGLMILGWFLGPAIIYGFGYLRCLPDTLHETPLDQNRTMRQRWSDFVLLASSFAILVIVGVYTPAIWANHSYISVPVAVALVIASCWLLAASAVASEKYLSWTMPDADAKTLSGWRPRIRVAVKTWGAWLVNLLGVKRAVVLGALLALSSLFIVVSGTFLGPEYKGYEIVAGNEAWPTVDGIDQPGLQALLLRTHRAVYMLSLFVAILAVVRILPWPRSRSTGAGRLLATLAGAIALFEFTNGAIGAIILQVLQSWAGLALWIFIWFVPAAVWWMCNLDSQDNRDRAHVAVMLFYLPIFFDAFAFWILHSYFSLGYGIFIAGMLLLWWGIVRNEHEIAQRQASRTT